MNAKHTPGPWTAVQGKEWNERPRIMARNKVEVARSGLDGFRNDSPETWANALLIAAAPELLKALENLAEYAADCASENDERPDALESARAALKGWQP